MSVFIRGTNMQVASVTDNGGVFIGQNIQTGWDSLSPEKTAGGFSMGDGNVLLAGYAAILSWDFLFMPTWDGDWKDNMNVSTMASLD